MHEQKGRKKWPLKLTITVLLTRSLCEKRNGGWEGTSKKIHILSLVGSAEFWSLKNSLYVLVEEKCKKRRKLADCSFFEKKIVRTGRKDRRKEI